MIDREPTLVIMAAGMGSRFGGLKQMTPVDPEGHFIIDFSLCDAHRAGFRRVVFIIKREHEQVFHETIGRRMEPHFDVRYVYQELTNIPDGLAVPEGRVKPWGTGHAVMCCRGVIDGPFAVLNSDDFYGPEAFSAMYQFLRSNDDPACYAMVGYHLRNTVTEFGSVARGICDVQDGMLRDVVERTKIFKRGRGLYRGRRDVLSAARRERRVDEFLGLHAEDAGGALDTFPGLLREGSSAKPAEMRVLSAVRRQCAAASRDGPRARTAVQRGLVRRDLSRGSRLRAGRDRAHEGRGPLSGGSLGQIKRSERRAPAS